MAIKTSTSVYVKPAIVSAWQGQTSNNMFIQPYDEKPYYAIYQLEKDKLLGFSKQVDVYTFNPIIKWVWTSIFEKKVVISEDVMYHFIYGDMDDDLIPGEYYPMQDFINNFGGLESIMFVPIDNDKLDFINAQNRTLGIFGK